MESNLAEGWEGEAETLDKEDRDYRHRLTETMHAAAGSN